VDAFIYLCEEGWGTFYTEKEILHCTQTPFKKIEKGFGNIAMSQTKSISYPIMC